jgi:signal peptidase I
MNGPSRIVRALYALFGYSSVQWAAGCWIRALVWDALFLAYMALVFQLPVWIIFALHFGQVIDAALLEPKSDRSDGGYAIVGMIACCVGILVAVTLRATWVEAFKIPSGSSIPTLLVGDHVFVSKRARHPRRGDTTVFIYPKERDKDFVKRVVAVGGDTIEIRDDQLVLNGQPVPRVHVDGPCEYDDFAEDSARWERRQCDAWDETLDGRTYRVIFDRNGGPHSFRPVTLPADNYFVLGDNRDNSHDSRFWGFVPQDLIKGVVSKIWLSEGPRGVRWDRIDKRVP